MNTTRRTHLLCRAARLVGLLGILAVATTARAQASPDFDAVSWTAIGCPVADLTTEASPRSTDFVGDATYPAAYYSFDANYLYFRYRMDGEPNGPGGFDQYTWTALMQVPSGNPFQYQYQVSLNGNTDTIELWQNTVASNIEFSPLFQDESEVKLFSQPYDLANGSTVNTTPLARFLPTGDGSSFGGGPDYFVDFAIPVAALVTNGVVASAPEIGGAVFFPATSTNPNNYNKGHLNCPFLPLTELHVDKTVDPSVIYPNVTTSLTYTIAVTNDGTVPGRGVMLEDIVLPGWMTNVVATVESTNPSVTWTVESTNPLVVRIPVLPVGATLSVDLSADAAPTCAHLDSDFLNLASIHATNSMDDEASVLLDVAAAATETCDGVDNTCDGVVDENPTAICDDDNVCNGSETCGGAAGCQAGTTLPCDDGNACTVDSCEPTSGCVNTATPGCTPCAVDADCNDGNACTTDACTAGICGSTTIPGCIPCTVDADCNDGQACTTDSCTAGSCSSMPIPGCVPCSVDADCNDGNACTTDVCTDGVCGNTALPGCTPCATSADCNDGNACTTDACTAGVCSITVTPGCVPCTTDADCADQDECTAEACVAGACSTTQIPDCGEPPVEECQNGLDDDGDALVDCSDPDCSADPACQREICGDCRDNDGDGLVDYEDADCCADPMSLGVSRMMLKPAAPKVRGKRMRLKAKYASFTPARFDPMSADTTLQVSDGMGQLFCHTVSSNNWKHPRARLYKFRDKRGTFAGGLKAGRFKVKRDGSIVFRTAGKRVTLRPTDGGPVRVTLRVGDMCSQSLTSLRQKRKALVFP